MVLKDQFVTNN